VDADFKKDHGQGRRVGQVESAPVPARPGHVHACGRLVRYRTLAPARSGARLQPSRTRSGSRCLAPTHRRSTTPAGGRCGRFDQGVVTARRPPAHRHALQREHLAYPVRSAWYARPSLCARRATAGRARPVLCPRAPDWRSRSLRLWVDDSVTVLAAERQAPAPRSAERLRLRTPLQGPSAPWLPRGQSFAAPRPPAVADGGRASACNRRTSSRRPDAGRWECQRHIPCNAGGAGRSS
jgi:hypothetical protein